MHRNDLGKFRPVFLRNGTGATIREELVSLAWARRGRKTHPDWDRAVIGLQTKRPFETGLLIAGKREETDDGFVGGTGAAVPCADHIPVCLPREVLVSVVRKDELDQPGRFLHLMHVGV